jgi:hypothetical protein
MEARYGPRVVATVPRTLDREAPAAIQDAVVDLWLLRATQLLVGTRGSSFSGLALFGREVPHALVGGATADGASEPRWPGAGVRHLVRRAVRAVYWRVFG